MIPSDERRLMLLVHLSALAVIVTSITSIACTHPDTLLLAGVAILGFVGGILFDRVILRPLTDWSSALARR
jgi:hypothetical protein